jgi:hypothetical protein
VIEEKTYYNLKHTSAISLRTYSKVIPSTAAEADRKIISEGAYRIGLIFTRDRLVTDQCFITIGQTEVQLYPTDLGVGVVAPQLVLWLDGDVTTVRDDEMICRFVNGSARSQLIVLFDRIVWKKDDNYYPAQALDKADLNALNQKKK